MMSTPKEKLISVKRSAYRPVFMLLPSYMHKLTSGTPITTLHHHMHGSTMFILNQFYTNRKVLLVFITESSIYLPVWLIYKINSG